MDRLVDMTEHMRSYDQAFVEKVDSFAATLGPSEQAMLMELIGGGVDEVEVAGFTAGWPGLIAIVPGLAGVVAGDVDSHAQAGVLFKDHTGFASTAGGSPNV